MATVYLAADLRHHRRVAITVRREQLGAAVGVERYEKEIELTLFQGIDDKPHTPPHAFTMVDARGAARRCRRHIDAVERAPSADRRHLYSSE